MAVTRMSKLTAICDQRHQESLLQTIQGLQRIEMRDLKKENTSNQWVKEYFAEEAALMEPTQEAELVDLQKDIQQAIQFIRHYGAKSKNFSLKRSFLSLQELEAGIDEEKVRKQLPEILALEKQWQKLTAEKDSLNEAETWLSHWQYLDINPNTLLPNYTDLFLVSLPASGYDAFKESIAKEANFYFEEIYVDEREVNLVLVFPKQAQTTATALLETSGGSKIEYAYQQEPKAELAEIKKQLTTNQKAMEELTRQVGQLIKIIPELQWAEEVFLARQQREFVKNQLIHSRYLVVIQGWISSKDQGMLAEEITQRLGADEVYLDFETPSEAEITEEVPIALENHPIVAPFELLTEMYSLPKYNEIDPTPWLMPFYFVFFGMMVADAGYGLLMLLATTFALKKMVLPTGIARFAKFFQILSLPTIAWGLIYGSFFGLTLPYTPILSTENDVVQIMILSVAFGFIQILVGLFIAAKEHIRQKDYLSAISDGFAWQGILIGIVIAVAGNSLLDNVALTYLGAAIAIISVLGILFIPVLQSTSKLKGFAKGAYSLYGITGYIGDLVSYTRLMALGISGGSIAAAFNLIVSYLPTGARFTAGIVLIIILQGLNIFLSLLSAFVHGARLQYVEFFGKFYSGGGRGFSPFKTAEKYVNIKRKED
ncbi:V-type ATP synthase subunit I [Enterococcus sp. HY326]|uniref:V-type ATP synthase subunit I n=1 Tax=Enterococcus sp. HY326 TaxID=2971265 RepID=UPI002240772D|nr:V-type ATP synthase subunit I [Enterococcus sp. HY326]